MVEQLNFHIRAPKTGATYLPKPLLDSKAAEVRHAQPDIDLETHDPKGARHLSSEVV